MGSTDVTAAGPVIAGHYRIVELLGEGGWARVYRATDLNLQREVALKRLRPDRFPHPDSARRLMREARTASRLSHPGIVTVFDAFEHDGTAWIVMELVDGVTLREVLQLRGALPVEEILRYAEELTSALGAAHAAGLLHRDITPRNVLISRDGRARLTDFGLACGYVAAEDASRAPTASTASALGGRTAGTPGYASPEQILGRRLDPRSDLFCLGLLLYEMCTGRAAFPSTSGGDLCDAVLHHEPMTIGRLNYGIPEELERIIHKAMAKRRDERYQNAADMLVDLKRLRRSVESSEGAPIGRHRLPGRRNLLKITVPAVALIGVAAGLFLIRDRLRPTHPPPPPSVPHQLTRFPGWEARPAISPDGDLIAYSSDQSGNPDIWLMDAARTGSPLRLTDDPGVDEDPAWFPDGSSLAFVSGRSGEPSIWKVPRLGGASILLVPDAEDPAVSPDGTKIAFSRRNAEGAYRIQVAPLNSPGNAVVLTREKDGLWEHRRPAWSPDGRMLAYEDFLSLWTIPAAGGRARHLTSQESSDHDPAWSSSGRFLYFSSYRAGTLAIWRMPAEGGEAVRMTFGAGPESEPCVSRDGRRLAYSTFVADSDIVLLDRRTGARHRIASERGESQSTFAPAGDRLLFLSNRVGTSDLWVQPLAGGAPEGAPRRLTDLRGGISRPGYSPDGSWIVLCRVIQGQRDIWIMPASGGPLERFTDHPAMDYHPAWSPDGSEIAFASDRDGLGHIWVAPVSAGRPAGPPRRLTSGPVDDMFPVWSPDGGTIAFLRNLNTETEVWTVQARGSGEPRRVTRGANADNLEWDAATGALYVCGNWGTDRIEIRSVDPASGKVQALDPPLVCGSSSADCALALSRDGRSIAFMDQEQRGDLWVLEAAPGSY